MRIGRTLQAVLLCVMAGSAAAQDNSPPPDSSTPPQAAPDQDSTPEPAATAEDTAAPATVPVREVRPESETPAVPAGEKAVVLDEVVVTAQKRAESLQQTPVSVTAFNAEKLRLRGIESVADLSANVPGLTIEPFPIDMATLRIFIRGVGTLDAQITQDPAIGVYQDGVYIGRSVGLAFDVADLERIEVLRGPQGTLYGRNTIGGAISLITRRPSPGAFTMEHKVSIGNRHSYVGKSTVNVPIGDDLAVKFAVLGSGRDGFVENTGAGGNFGDRIDRSARFDARWLASDWLTADYSYDYSHLNYYQYMYQAILHPESDHGLAEYFKRYAETQTVYSNHRLDRLSSGSPMNPSDVRIDGHAVTLTATQGTMELKYIGAHRTLNNLAYADLSGGNGSPDYRLDPNYYDGPSALDANGGRPTPLAWLRAVQSQTSHELQLTGDVFDESLKFIAGLFYFKETAYDDRMFPVTHQFHSQAAPAQLAAIIALNPQLAGDLINLAGPRLVNLIQGQRDDVDSDSKALYGQATWTPGWFDSRSHFTFGYRHTVDNRAAMKNYISLIYVEGVKGQDPTAVLVPDLPGNDRFDHERASRKFTNNSFSYIAAFDVTPAINTYAKYVQAYKSGGFDVRDPQKSGNTGPASDSVNYGFGFVDGFAPEYVNSTEAGVKTEWFDRRLRVNLNLFNMDYTDRQISALIAGTIADTKTRNVGRSRIRGVELDAMAALSRGLVLATEYSYLDAKTIEVLDINGNNVAKNYQPYSTPKNSFVTALDWTMLERSWGALHSYLTYNYMSQRNGQTLPGKVGLTSLDAYGLFNARCGLVGMRIGSKGMVDAALWGKNITDREYPSTAIDNLPQADRSVIWGESRTFGLDLTYHWY